VTAFPLRLLAVGLALVGQLVGVFGLPVVRGTSADSVHRPDSLCGCCPADRTAGRCCCAKVAGAPACCSTASEPEEEPAPCCQAHRKKPAAVVVYWSVPSMRQKCLGTSDPAPLPVSGPSVPPGPPVAWQLEPQEARSIPVPSPQLLGRTLVPDDPPPRLALATV
jgi:hypothetical protein